MANVGIMFDKIGFLPLTLTETVAGVTTVVPTPPDDAFAVVSSGASLAMTIGVDPGGSGVTGVILTPQVMLSDPTNSGGGFTGNVTDSSGDVAVVIGPFDITAEPVIPNITAGTLSFTANPTPPTAPGP
jgi:hypothetical protein